jgi:hypothetical protein
MADHNNIYAVSARKNGGKTIRMPPDAEGYYLREVLENGTVIYYPVQMNVDKSALATLAARKVGQPESEDLPAEQPDPAPES